MSKLEKIQKLRIGNYLRELSVVIIGVAATLFAGGLINEMKEKKDLKLQLNSIYTELENNLERIDRTLLYYRKIEKLSDFLQESIRNPSPHINDSINKYKDVANWTLPFAYKKGAYDMFVNSGIMKQFTDREQLLNITECYSLLEVMKQEHEVYISSKMLIFNEIYKMKTEDIFKYDIMDPPFYISFNFHTLNNSIESPAIEAKIQIEKTLENRLN